MFDMSNLRRLSVMTAHSKAALAAGATEAELSETVFVAMALRAGAALTHGTHLFQPSA
jgi:alkylhydroperoxidase/carboxymuconolactone decarboxylase family protein YurZ